MCWLAHLRRLNNHMTYVCKKVQLIGVFFLSDKIKDLNPQFKGKLTLIYLCRRLRYKYVSGKSHTKIASPSVYQQHIHTVNVYIQCTIMDSSINWIENSNWELTLYYRLSDSKCIITILLLPFQTSNVQENVIQLICTLISSNIMKNQYQYNIKDSKNS